jgi:hypothetical protein
MPVENDGQPTVDFLILADRAEAVNGKLYMMGGGWDRLYLAEFGQPQPISIGIGILVPWLATNMNHNLAIRIDNQDGGEIASLTLSFNTGRPPILGQAETQRIVLAFQLAPQLPAPGSYQVKSFINDQESKTVVFYANQLPTPPTTIRPR